MSAEYKTKEWLLRNERALQSIAKGRTVKFAAGLHQVPVADLQGWLKEFNGGSDTLTMTRILEVKRSFGSASVERISTATTDEGAEPAEVVPPAAEHSARNTAAPKAYDKPWLTKRWRGDGFKGWRETLERLALDPTQTLLKVCEGSRARAMSFAGFKAGWLGTGEVSAAAIREFIAFGDEQIAGGGPKAPAAVKPPKAAKKTEQPRARRAKRRKAKPTPQPRQKSAGDWEEIGAVLPPVVAARYTPSVHRLVFVGSEVPFLRKLGFKSGAGVRVFWRAGDRRLRVQLGAGTFTLRPLRDSVAISGKDLSAALGAVPLAFVHADQTAPNEVELSAIGGAS